MKLIHKTDKYAVFLSENDKEVSVYVVPAKGEQIHQPLGYMLGFNALIYKLKPAKPVPSLFDRKR